MNFFVEIGHGHINVFTLITVCKMSLGRDMHL